MRYLAVDLNRTFGSEKKMAFVSGPRQVGKTTLAQKLLKEVQSEQGYFNWDIEITKRMILKDPTYFWQGASNKKPSRIVLDEIHKYPRWKRFLKGFYDANKNEVEMIVTGSGRLDIYQRGGDSLFGRYHLYHLFPFSLGELNRKDKMPPSPEEFLQQLLEGSPSSVMSDYELLWNRNGFPEPLFAEDTKNLIRWQNDHRNLILREDLRDLTQIRELGLLEMMISLLPERIGSLLSINALREDVGVNFLTAKNWLETLSRFFYLFFVKPYGGKLARTLKKETKVYLYDWSEIEDPARRFENLVALHLLKACAYWTDAGYGDYRLCYLRDKEKRETDFIVISKHKPFFLVECKLREKNLDPSLEYFHGKIKPKVAFQVIHEGAGMQMQKRGDNIYTVFAPRFLTGLP